MNSAGKFWRRMKMLFQRGRFERELGEEMRLHREMREREEREAGSAPDEARYAAARRFGNVLELRERGRDMWKWNWLEDFFQDVQYGLRLIRKNAGFSAIVVMTLALGIGASTAVFGVADAVLLRPLPYGNEKRLMMVWETNAARSGYHNVVSPANFQFWKKNNTVFDEMAGMYDQNRSLTGEGEPEQIPAQSVSTNIFTLLGVSPLLGRTFSAEEGVANQNHVVILSYGLWKRKFGGDANVVGKTIQLSGVPHVVVGVMPATARLFVPTGSQTGAPPQLWVPIGWPTTTIRPGGRFMMAVARLRSGVSIAEAQGQMDSIVREYTKLFPDFETGWGVRLVPVHKELAGTMRSPLVVLLGAVGFVLLIACANVANLMLSQSAARDREIAVRIALGAGRGRIVRQALTESLVLAAMGGALGYLVALWGNSALLSLAPKNLLGAQEVHMDFRVLIFTTAISILCGLILGAAPAYGARRSAPMEALREGGRSLVAIRGKSLRNIFAVGEIALSLILLAGAGLLIRSFTRLLSVEPGFNPSNLLMMRMTLPATKYSQTGQNIQFFQQMLERVRTLPGVRSATITNSFPLTGTTSGTSFDIVGKPIAPAGARNFTEVQIVEPDYFRTLGIPLLRGRTFSAEEETAMRHVVVISETMAREYFPNEDPIGKKLIIDMKEQNDADEIVGIVGDVKRAGLDSSPGAICYWPHAELPLNSMMLGVRVESDPMALVGSVRGIVAQIDKDLPIFEVETLEHWMGDSVARQRFSALLVGLFAGIAFVLAAVGVYGVIAYAVSQRTREFGVRMALGAEAGDVAWLVLKSGLQIAAIGISLGLLGGLGISQFLRGLLFHVSPYDPVTFVCVAAALGSVTLVACWVPARRATKVDPMVALRQE